ncbi:hypothetical protein ACFLSJ_02635 [Verrucomicrobiota bacterium]
MMKRIPHTVIASLTLAVITGCGTISDRRLIDRFNENRSDFEKLVQMVGSDTNLHRIVERKVEYKPNAAPPLSSSRLDAYFSLMKKLHLSSVSAVHREPGRFSFRAKEVRFGGQGYLYSPGKPRPVVNELDGYEPDTPGSFSVYRQIEDGWYLYLSKGM